MQNYNFFWIFAKYVVILRRFSRQRYKFVCLPSENEQ